MTGRYYTPDRLSPVICPGCLQALPLGTANAGERRHPTCWGSP
jgi:hypothetical protein